MKVYCRSSISGSYDDIFCMSNIRGRKITNPGKQNFSFYYSRKNSNHGIRVKVVFNPDRIIDSDLGVLMLHGDYNYMPSEHDKDVSNKEILKMKDFFKRFKVLFSAVWENELPEDAIDDYLRGNLGFKGVLAEFYDYESRKSELNRISTLGGLEEYVRSTNWFSMND